MTYEKKDFLDAVREKAQKRQFESVPAMRVLQAASVVMEKLTTRSDEWNRFLSYIQGQIEKTRQRKAVAETRQNDPAIWDIPERNKLKADIIAADAMISALEWAMELPKALIDGGAEATEFLNKLDKEKADA